MFIALFLNFVANLHQDIRRGSDVATFRTSHSLGIASVLAPDTGLLCTHVVLAALWDTIGFLSTRVPLGLHFLKIVTELGGRGLLLGEQM